MLVRFGMAELAELLGDESAEFEEPVAYRPVVCVGNGGELVECDGIRNFEICPGVDEGVVPGWRSVVELLGECLQVIDRSLDGYPVGAEVIERLGHQPELADLPLEVVMGQAGVTQFAGPFGLITHRSRFLYIQGLKWNILVDRAALSGYPDVHECCFCRCLAGGSVGCFAGVDAWRGGVGSGPSGEG